ncbi:hypothetical protein IAU59_005098 [Kwoniella sp. CBS 9459]
MAPVHIIVGTTLATAAVVIGTGYVLKKYIYDPHLSHHVEAFLATHQHVLNRPHAAENEPYPSHENAYSPPIPPSKGSTTATAYKDHRTTLRRRGRPSVSDLNPKGRLAEYELEERHYSHPKESQGRSYGYTQDDDRSGLGYEGQGASTYELDESRLSLLGDDRHQRKYSVTSTGSVAAGGVQALIDIEGPGMKYDRPESAQDAEVREVIFRLAPTPTGLSQSRSSTPASSIADTRLQSDENPFLSPEDPSSISSPAHPLSLSHKGVPSPRTAIAGFPDLAPSPNNMDRTELLPPAPSTTFSFLSLSQQSSPEQIHPHLDSLSFSSAFAVSSPSDQGGARQVEYEGSPTIPDDNQYENDNHDDADIISLPETSTTSYEDAESYTPISRALSPEPSATAASWTDPVHNRLPPSGDYSTLSELGLNYIPLVTIGSRGPMSVISVSGSEAEGDVEGEWDIVSDVGR